MFLSFGVYWTAWRWQFALGLVGSSCHTGSRLNRLIQAPNFATVEPAAPVLTAP
jgi:hypothetical protein